MLATLLCQAGALEDAASAAEHACRLRPALPPYWLTRGNIALGLSRFDEAEEYFLHAIKLAPQFAMAHFRLGVCRAAVGLHTQAIQAFRQALCFESAPAEIHFCLAESLLYECQWGAAMQSYEAAFQRDPQNTLERLPAMECMRSLKFDAMPEFWHAEIIRFFQRSDINKSRHIEVGLRALKSKPHVQEILANLARREPVVALPSPLLHAVAADPLLHLLLVETVLTDWEVERLLTALRSAILLNPGMAKNFSIEFKCALAIQCFNNEYVYAESTAEIEAAERLLMATAAQATSGESPLDPSHIAMLAMYRPIQTIPGLEMLAATTLSRLFSTLIRRAVTDVNAVQAERDRIQKIGHIEDQTSRQVRDMYEQNPYPRWLSLDQFSPLTLAQWMPQSSALQLPPYAAGNVIKILVAGCGTGKEACELAANISGAQVLAVDLSLSSLAYAQHMAKKLNLGNIEFRQADILKLEALDTQFDLISSSGVLHHMKDPEAGLSVLAHKLRPGGLMRIALYSNRAREAVNLARTTVRDQAFTPDKPGIRNFRQSIAGAISQESMKALRSLSDFYALSSCRDLVFHVMEHQYRLPQIATMLQRAQLTPVDLIEGLPRDVVAEYQRRFPGDPAMLDFESWDEFEQAFPGIFTNMYSIRCQKAVAKTNRATQT